MWPGASQGSVPIDQLAIEGVGDLCYLACVESASTSLPRFWWFSLGYLHCLDVGEMCGFERKNLRKKDRHVFFEPNVDIKLAYHPKHHLLCRWYVFTLNWLWLGMGYKQPNGYTSFHRFWVFLLDSFYGKNLNTAGSQLQNVFLLALGSAKTHVLSAHHPMVYHVEFLMVEAYIAVCVLWTFCCSLSRSSPRHGYTVTVAPRMWNRWFGLCVKSWLTCFENIFCDMFIVA